MAEDVTEDVRLSRIRWWAWRADDSRGCASVRDVQAATGGIGFGNCGAVALTFFGRTKRTVLSRATARAVWVPETLAGDFRKLWPVPVMMVAQGRV